MPKETSEALFSGVVHPKVRLQSVGTAVLTDTQNQARHSFVQTIFQHFLPAPPLRHYHSALYWTKMYVVHVSKYS